MIGSLYSLSCQQKNVLPADKELLKLSFEGVALTHVTKADANRWQLVVPYGVDLRQLIPEIAISPGATVVPASGQPQDFRKPVHLTITAADGSKVVYTIVVTNQPQPVPLLTKVSTDSLEAGKSLLITGHHFGLFNLAVNVTVSKDNKLVGTLPHNVIDSTHVSVAFPEELAPGRYMIRVSVNGVPSANTLPVEIQYPTPRITKLITRHLRQEDTLQLRGNFVDLLHYAYDVVLTDNQQKTYRLPTVSGITTVATTVLPATIQAGTYQVQVLNRTTGRLSTYASLPIQIYERIKAFFTGIQNNATSFTAGQLIAFRTSYFDAVPSRFYQVQLTNGAVSYTINGIYTASQHVLTVELPDQLIADTYTVSCRLLDSLGQPVYQFDSDLQLSLQ